MLEYLRIRNLALIEDAELDFAPGMNVLTGETGAGKSFILKALGLLLGDRLGADMVRQGAEKAQVEAQFQMDGREIVIRRSLLAESGRSRLYVDDALRSQECVRSLREQLLAHASQHGQQQLLQPAFQARLMESTLKDPDLLRRRDELLEQLRSVEARRKELRAREAHLLERRDILEMQQQEIDRVAPEAGEEERLEEQRAIVRAAEQTREQYELALGLLHGEEEPGLLDMLGRLERCLHQMARTDDSVSEDADAVTALRQQLSHLSGRLRRPPLPEDMPDVEQMEERLYALAQLKRKLHRSLDEILELREEIRENISFLDACALDITLLDKEEKQLAAQLQDTYQRAVVPINCVAMTAEALDGILQRLLYEFPIREIAVQMPSWVMMLEPGHWLQSAVYTAMLKFAGSVHKMADIAGKNLPLECEYITKTMLTGMDLASGSVHITAMIAPDIFYKILGEQTGLSIVDEASLLPCVVSLAKAKRAYDKIKSALDQVEATGYGIVMPGIEELTLEEPEIVRQGGQYGVRLSASAPSLHIMRANIHTELSPTVGSEQQGEELIKSLLADFETDPGKLWNTNIFGKSLNELVSEGVQAKLLHMPQEARSRLQSTLERIINEGCDGLICILL